MRSFIRAERLIDGKGGVITGQPVVEIEGTRIKGVHKAAPEGAQVQDFGDATILPGLIDTHVHLNMPGNGMLLEEVMREGPEVLLATSMGSSAAALGAGITTVRDVGCFGTTAFSVRRTLELGYARGARVMAAGAPITITGGHTWYMGGEADGEAALRQKVRALIKDGAEFIKVMGSGGGTIGTASWRPAFTQAEMNAIVEESHWNERRVTVHCLCAESIDIAINAGVDQIEHAGFIRKNAPQQYNAQVAERLAKSGIPVTTTLAVGATAINAMRQMQQRDAEQEAFLGRWERMLAENVEQFTKLSEAGVTFVAGTDAGWRFTSFDSLVLEMQMMQQGEMPVAECITAATGRAAEVIGLDDRGRIEAGLLADLIVVKGNPLDDLAALHDLELILQGGVAHPPSPRAHRAPQAMIVPE
ncbi:amidohydrolase family protein [Seohaeicola nanhaiensis]|uniref:Amidohydrolase family protein n=1 Tax=Seohaeicola nanhaiensis TaxID=1387282 RepID=A0ABV9KNE8_9RHOB